MKSLPDHDPIDPVQPPADAENAWLSALADGQADDADRACRAWRDSEAARRSWHEYHLIGDVMRSQELATPPARDAAFLAGLRERLAGEAVVLAPEPSPATNSAAAPASQIAARRRQPWLLPTAAAAGFAFVAGALLVGRMGLPGSLSTEPAFAAASGAGATPGGGPPLVRASNAGRPGVPGTVGAGQPRYVVSAENAPILLRDPLLDDYLRAHQLVRGGVPVATPGGTFRSVDLAVTLPDARQPAGSTERAASR